jgi:hypothetical protein
MVGPMSESERLIALDVLHTLAQQIDKGRGDAAELIHAGYSDHTAHELANLIDMAHGRRKDKQ